MHSIKFWTFFGLVLLSVALSDAKRGKGKNHGKHKAAQGKPPNTGVSKKLEALIIKFIKSTMTEDQRLQAYRFLPLDKANANKAKHFQKYVRKVEYALSTTESPFPMQCSLIIPCSENRKGAARVYKEGTSAECGQSL